MNIYSNAPVEQVMKEKDASSKALRLALILGLVKMAALVFLTRLKGLSVIARPLLKGHFAMNTSAQTFAYMEVAPLRSLRWMKVSRPPFKLKTVSVIALQALLGHVAKKTLARLCIVKMVALVWSLTRERFAIAI